jgi:hypothetical protein
LNNQSQLAFQKAIVQIDSVQIKFSQLCSPKVHNQASAGERNADTSTRFNAHALLTIGWLAVFQVIDATIARFDDGSPEARMVLFARSVLSKIEGAMTRLSPQRILSLCDGDATHLNSLRSELDGVLLEMKTFQQEALRPQLLLGRKSAESDQATGERQQPRGTDSDLHSEEGSVAHGGQRCEREKPRPKQVAPWIERPGKDGSISGLPVLFEQALSGPWKKLTDPRKVGELVRRFAGAQSSSAKDRALGELRKLGLVKRLPSKNTYRVFDEPIPPEEREP